jgi:hypothetical protein
MLRFIVLDRKMTIHMQKHVDIDRKQLPCGMLFGGKNKNGVGENMKQITQLLLNELLAEKEKVQKNMFPAFQE